MAAPYDKLTLTVTECARLLGISRGSAYEGIRRGEIPSVRLGRRLLVPRAALERMLEGQTQEKADAGNNAP